jgi:hypothetical protein
MSNDIKKPDNDKRSNQDERFAAPVKSGENAAIQENQHDVHG